MGKVQDGLAVHVGYIQLEVSVVFTIPFSPTPLLSLGKHLLKYSDINLFCDDLNLQTPPLSSLILAIIS